MVNFKALIAMNAYEYKKYSLKRESQIIPGNQGSKIEPNEIYHGWSASALQADHSYLGNYRLQKSYNGIYRCNASRVCKNKQIKLCKSVFKYNSATINC